MGPAVLVAIPALLAYHAVIVSSRGLYTTGFLDVILAAPYVFFLLRQRRVGVKLESDAIVLQRTLRTKRIPWSEITDVRTIPSLFFWTRGVVIRSNRSVATRRVPLPGILTVAARRNDPLPLGQVKEAWQAATGRHPSGLDSLGQRSLATAYRILIGLGIGVLGPLAVWHPDWGSRASTLVWGSGLACAGIAGFVWRRLAHGKADAPTQTA